MDEETLNISIRRFLKTVGITSQREIEKAVRSALANGRLEGVEAIPAQARIRLDGLEVDIRIDGRIELG